MATEFTSGSGRPPVPAVDSELEADLTTAEGIRHRLREIASGRWSHQSAIFAEHRRLPSDKAGWSATLAIAQADAAEAVKLEATLRAIESEPTELNAVHEFDPVELVAVPVASSVSRVDAIVDVLWGLFHDLTPPGSVATPTEAIRQKFDRVVAAISDPAVLHRHKPGSDGMCEACSGRFPCPIVRMVSP